MVVNRFSRPVKDEYISLYVPIPFELLYAIGKAYNDDVDKAYNQLSELVLKWSDFKSPSQVDTKRWYDLTMAPAKQMIDDIAKNPDLMKSVEGRARVQLFINSRPYLELSMLKQSKDLMLARLAVELKLSLAGKYNPLWHQFDYSNYDTLNPNNGVFQDVNLTPYMSEVDLVKPYVDNLQDEFIPDLSGGWYDYKGVTTDRTDEAVRLNLSAIYNTPEAQMHLKALVKQGYTPEDAQKLFADRIYRAGREFSRVNRELNALGRYASTHGTGSSDNSSNRPFLLTEGLQLQGMTAYLKGKEMYLSKLPQYRTAVVMVNSGDPKLKEAGLKIISDLRKNKDINMQTMFNSIMDDVENYLAPITLGNENKNQGQLLTDYTNAVLNNFGVDLKSSELNDHLATTIKGVSLDKKDTSFGKKRTISNGVDLNLTSQLILDIANSTNRRNMPKVNSIHAFLNALHSNKFLDMILLDNGSILPIPTTVNGRNEVANYQTMRVAIPLKSIELAGLTPEDMEAIGATFSSPEKGGTTVSETSTTSGKVNADGEKKPKKYSDSSSKTTKPENNYWVVNLSNMVTNPDDVLGQEAVNRGWLQKSVGPSMADPEYTYIQQKALQ